MGFNTGELTAIWEIEAALTREEDRQDFERELAGIDIGRDARFHSAAFVEDRRDGRSGTSAAERRERRDSMSRLQMLLASNPAYAKLYNDTFDLLGEAEAATDRAIAKAEAALKEAQEQLEQTLSRAATLPVGTRVFRDARGQVWNERGERVSDADAAGIVWRGDEPAYEQFVVESKSASDRLTRLEELQGFRVDTLGRIRDRMSDKENPITAAELQDAQQEIQSKLAEHHVQATVARTAAIEDQPAASISVAVPVIP